MIAILKYNAGNITSVENAINRLGYSCIITENPDIIKNSEKVIFPGVGEASSAMKYLKNNHMDKLIASLTQPVLGICLGMQLLCKFSEEGGTDGIGIFDNIIKKFPPKDLVPHMGWNNVNHDSKGIFRNIKSQEDFYFVHSYYATLGEETVSETDYILTFSSALQKNNFYAVQFHPEKSAKAGEQFLQNFLEL